MGDHIYMYVYSVPAEDSDTIRTPLVDHIHALCTYIHITLVQYSNTLLDRIKEFKNFKQLYSVHIPFRYLPVKIIFMFSKYILCFTDVSRGYIYIFFFWNLDLIMCLCYTRIFYKRLTKEYLTVFLFVL